MIARLAAALTVIITVILLAGCHVQNGYPQACANHGGTRVVIKGLNYCHDGTTVGDGWLWTHHRTEAP